jgi:hypothetical protein
MMNYWKTCGNISREKTSWSSLLTQSNAKPKVDSSIHYYTMHISKSSSQTNAPIYMKIIELSKNLH